MIRVGHLMPSISRSGGGVYEVVRYLARELKLGKNFDVSVYGLIDKFTETDAIEWFSVKTYSAKILGPEIFGYSRKLSNLLQEGSLDILHTHGLWKWTSFISWRWTKMNNQPNIISIHGMLDPWAVRNSYLKKKIAKLLYENKHLKNASCIHALCKEERDAIRAYGLKNPIAIIPNGVDLPSLDEVLERPIWDSEIPEDSKILLFLGRIHPKKGLKNLIHGWDQVNKENTEFTDWHLVIAGWDQGGYESELKALVSGLGFSKRLHFIGPQYGLQKKLTIRRASAFILPSLSEGLPMTILEAWSFGIPVLMTSECNLQEGFTSGAALQIDHTVKGISAGISKILSMNQAELIEMGAIGRRLVEERFNWQVIGRQVEQMYQWVLSKNEPPDFIEIEFHVHV